MDSLHSAASAKAIVATTTARVPGRHSASMAIREKLRASSSFIPTALASSGRKSGKQPNIAAVSPAVARGNDSRRTSVKTSATFSRWTITVAACHGTGSSPKTRSIARK
jgi:hypothetical protein